MKKTMRNSCALMVLIAVAGQVAWAQHGEKARGAMQTAKGPIRHVIIVSVDGLLPASYTEPDAHGLKVPALRAIVRDGVYCPGARSVFPTTTYPAHTAVATGTNPGRHGILSNTAWDPLEKNQGGWRWYSEDIRVPALWDAARTKGLRTALVWWPATVGAHADALVPDFWRANTPDDIKLLRAVSTPGLFDAVEKRFPNFRAGLTLPEVKNESAADVAVYAIETLRPHLLMLHVLEVDHWEHSEGLFTPRTVAAIEDADQQITRLITAAKKAGIWEQTALVVVSDHGFVPITQRVRPGVWLREKGLATLDDRNRMTDWKAVVLANGGSAYLYVKDEKDEATKRALLEMFRELAGKPGSGIARVYRQEEIRALGGDATAFLALEAAAGFAITGGYAGDVVSPATVAATHGYNPERADMQASLLIYGPPIGAGQLAHARLIDVAPTVARWLGLKLDQADGAPLEVPLRAAKRR